MAMTDILEIMQQMAHKRVSTTTTTTKEEIDRALSENSCLSPEEALQVLEFLPTDD